MTNEKRVTKSSVAAFVLLPQFSMCLRPLREELVPIFKGLLVGMLASRCLPYNYRESVNLSRVTIMQVLGDAWFHLRTGGGTVPQWGYFISFILLMFFIAASILTLFSKLMLGWGQIAHAQVFAHPTNPYTATPGDTGLTAVQNLGAAGGVIFDKRFTVGEASSDYALMLLDKVLRQPALGTAGSMQNALTALMQVYNTGILVIAAVMIFWMILSIVVDTAKTGIVGGGRHNMIWTPIRVVFALGIMIPLGTTGFSSGQFAVMKLAEWGSNFGSQAWDRYLSAVTMNTSVLARFRDSQSPAQIASAFARIKTCQVAYNALVQQQSNPDTSYLVQRRISGYTEGNTSFMWEYTNSTAQGLCGTVEFSSCGSSATNCGAFPVSTVGNEQSHAAQVAVTAQNNLQNVPTAQYHQLVRAGIADGFWAMETAAHNFACAYVGKHLQPNDASATNPVVMQSPDVSGGTLCTQAQLNECGVTNGGTPNATFPTVGCIQQMTSNFQTALVQAVNSNLDTIGGYVENNFLTDMRRRGWAGMGMFHLTIQQMNNAVQSYNEPGFSFTPATVDPNNGSYQDRRTSEIVDDYERWWPTATRAAQTQQPTDISEQLPKERPADSWLGRRWQDVKGAWTGLSRMALSAGGPLMFDLVEPNDPDAYPLAELAATGNQIVMWGLTLLGLSAATSGIGGKLVAGLAGGLVGTGGAPKIGTVVGAVAGLALSGPISSFLKTAGWLVFAAGMVMSYYIPILPFIRVAFAVLTWIVSVFQAVVMLPLAALVFLTSEGEGMGSGPMRGVWLLWLNVLVRPVLVVAGFVGSILIFNSFVVFFQHSFTMTVTLTADSGNPLGSLMGRVVYTVVYVGLIYSAANTSLKLLDLLPDAMTRWMGMPGRDDSFDDGSTEKLVAMGLMTGSMRGGGGGGGSGLLGQLGGGKGKLAAGIAKSVIK